MDLNISLIKPMCYLTLKVVSFIFVPVLLWLALSPNPAISLLWDLANISGLISVMALMMLFFYTGRPLASPPYEGKFFARLHQYLGYFCLLTLLVHIVVLIYIEPLTLNYLLPSARLSMLSGTLSALLIVFLALASQAKVRSKIWKGYQSFRNFHYLAAVLTLLLAGLHIIDTEFYLSSAWEQGGLLLLVIISTALPKYGLQYWPREAQTSSKTSAKKKPDKKPPRVKGVSLRALYITLALSVISAITASVLTLIIQQMR